MFLSIPFRRRMAIYVEHVPLAWSEFLSVQRRVECGRYQTLDVIVGPVRVIVSRRL